MKISDIRLDGGKYYCGTFDPEVQSQPGWIFIDGKYYDVTLDSEWIPDASAPEGTSLLLRLITLEGKGYPILPSFKMVEGRSAEDGPEKDEIEEEAGKEQGEEEEQEKDAGEKAPA